MSIAQLDAAAAGHTHYLTINKAFDHQQQVGRPGFTVATPLDRAIEAGIAQAKDVAVSEVQSGFGAALPGVSGLSNLFNALYHARILLDDFKDVADAQ